MRLALFALLALAGCVPRQFGADVSHDVGKPVAQPSQWISHSPDLVQIWLREPANAQVPADHPAQVRAQAWMDALDAALRRTHPALLDGVPKPEAMVLVNDEVNGYSFSVPVCFDVPVDLGPAAGGTGTIPTIDFPQNEGQPREPEGFACVRADQSVLRALVDTYQAQLRHDGSECELSLDTQGVHLSGACARVPNASAARGLRLRAVSTRLLFTSALFRAFTEEDFVAALAHELAHFYRAHSVAAPAQAAYFYQHDPRDVSMRPARTTDVALVRTGEELRRFGAIPYYFPVPGQSLHRTAIAYALLNPARSGSELARTAPTSCGRIEACLAPCTAFRTLWEDAEARKAVVQDPGAMTQRQREKYLAVEQGFLACAEQLKLEGRGQPASLESDILEQVMPPALVQEARQRIRNARPRTLRAGLEIYGQVVQESEVRYLELAREAEARGLGYYTGEQEADDLSLEILAEVGVPATAATDMMLKALKEYAAPLDPAQWNYEQCRTAHANGWPAVPPVGDWSAFHHSTCYRVYNLAREARAHRYQPDPAKRPAFRESWEDIQRSFADRDEPHLGTPRR